MSMRHSRPSLGPARRPQLGLPEEEQTPCCSIGSVYVGDEVDFAAGNDDVVLAPDESYAVDVGNFVDTDPAVCLEAVIGAVEGSSG